MALEPNARRNMHLPEEALENYAFGRLSDAQLADFEEHLLVCERCQARLEAEDNFAEAMLALGRMKNAAVKTFPNPAPASVGRHVASHVTSHVQTDVASGNRGVVKMWRRPAWRAGLVGTLAVVVGFATLRLTAKLPGLWTSQQIAGRTSEQVSEDAAQSITLKTLRGGSADGIAEARSNRPLDLSIDSMEAANSSLDDGPYHLEVVDAEGREAWAGRANASDHGKITTHVEKRLAAGVYWVRLYAQSGKLLREFGLHLGS
jgi:hypothetical protein